MSTENEVARPRGTPWNEINRLTAENRRLRAALHNLVIAAEQSGQPLGEWAAEPFGQARAALEGK